MIGTLINAQGLSRTIVHGLQLSATPSATLAATRDFRGGFGRLPGGSLLEGRSLHFG